MEDTAGAGAGAGAVAGAGTGAGAVAGPSTNAWLQPVLDNIVAKKAAKSRAVRARQTAEAKLEEVKAKCRLVQAQGRELTKEQRADLRNAKNAVENAALIIGDCEDAINAIVPQAIAAYKAAKIRAVKARQTAEAKVEELRATHMLAKAQGRELAKAQRAELLTAKHAVENAVLTINDCEEAIVYLQQHSAVIVAQAHGQEAKDTECATVLMGETPCPVSLARTLPRFAKPTILQTHFKECTDSRHIEILLDDVNYFSAFIQTARAAQVQRRHNDSAGAATETDDGAGAGGGEGSPGKRPETAARASPMASMHPRPAASTGKRHRAGAASEGAHLPGGVSTGKRRRADAASVAGAPPVQDPSSASRHANPPASEDDLARLLGESLRRERTLKRRLKEAVRSLEYEQDNRHAAALTSRCPGVDLEELAALVGLAGRNDFAPCTASGGEEGRLRRSVFAIKHVHDTAGRVLAASSYTPAGILRSVLLKVAKPKDEVSSELLSHVMVYINREGGRDWTPRQRAHLGAANALAAAMTNKAIAGWQQHRGELTLECMQVGPIVRQALATVFERLHGDVPLPAAMIALVAKGENERKRQKQARANPARNDDLCGGELRVKSDIAVYKQNVVLALGETKLRRGLDRYKLACMSAAACGCLQLKILGECKTTQLRHVFGKCFCGPQESLFPIPLVESYSNVIRLYYGKTVHDEEGGLCSHRVGCFFDLTMHTWSDALLALSVMQATANDVFARWQCMPEFELRAAKLSLPGLRTLRQAPTQTYYSLSDQPSRFNTTPDEGASTAEYSAADLDVAALKAAGVAEAAPLYTRPVVLYEAGATPPVARGPRVYRGTWKHSGAARDVVVKVVSRRQAAHEARVLKAVSVRPEARAIQVLAQIPINGNGGEVGLVTPYCSGGELFRGAASVHDVLRQAVQLCKAVMAWHAAGVLHLDIKPANIATTSTGDVVVLDAGVSRFTKKGSATVRGAVGTPGYIAPELQGNGRHAAVAACDVFSLGATYRAALDRWVRRSQRLVSKSARLSSLRKVCNSMQQSDGAKRPTLPEVLTALNTLLCTSPHGGSPHNNHFHG